MNAIDEAVMPTERVIEDEPARLSAAFLMGVYAYVREVRPQYQLAAFAGIAPEVFSRIINGRLPIRPGDKRITRVGALLGLEPHECFED